MTADGFPMCDGCNRVCDGAGDMTHFATDDNVDTLDLCEPCADQQRDAFVVEVATMLGRPLTDEETERVWGAAHLEFDSEAVAEKLMAERILGPGAYFWSHPGNTNGSNNWVEIRDAKGVTHGIGQTLGQAMRDVPQSARVQS